MTSMMDSLTKLGLFTGGKPPPNGHVSTNNMDNLTMAGSPPVNDSATPTLMDTILSTAGSSSPLLQILLFVYRLFGFHTGLDPSILLTLGGVLWGLQYLFFQAYTWVEEFVEKYLMCSIAVSQDDSIYYHVMEWMSKQPSLNNHRYLTAQTEWRSAWDEDEEDAENGETQLFWTDAGQGGMKYLNFSNHAARSVPRYVPAMGSTSFWHKKVRFRLYRKKESLANSNGWGSAFKDTEEIRISCYGRSILPIKQLLAEAKMAYYHDTHQKTTIYRPRHKEQRRDSSMWQQVARRPVRPMSTVVLDSKEKHDVLGDINEYLHPRTPRWYASRGIPLRRGYLFHGPPGTGKTSFSFALAGVFGIDIYVISLQDISVTEEDLAILFTRLPRRCIVLLEDIDTAGLRRSDEDATEENKDGEAEKKEKKEGEKEEKPAEKTNGTTEKKKKKAKKQDSDTESASDSDSSADERKSKAKRKTKKKKGKGKGGDKVLSLESISLSGLLNAIDGVASHEGRILIMTTNKPESLDDALVRPGRVDRQVAFTHASSTQACELFNRMYEVAWKRSAQKIQALAPASLRVPLPSSGATSEDGSKLVQTPKVTAQEPNGSSTDDEDEKPVSEEELKRLAEDFGKTIPEGVFSPAEIQGFLLKRKSSPRKAIADVQEWIEATIKQKESKSKVSVVQ